MKHLSTLLQIIALLWLSTSWSVAGFILNPYRFSSPPAPPPGGDPDFASVALLLHFDGTNGSTTFTDNSPTPKTATGAGNAQITTTNPQFGSGALLLDGTGDYVSVPSSADFNFGTGDFTIEFWLRYSSISGYQVISERGWTGTGGLILQTGLNTGRIWVYLQNVLVAQEPATSNNTNQWYFYAITRSSSTVRIFRDGVQTASGTSSTNITSSSALNIGAYGAGNLYFVNGRLDDVRITKGMARYTSGFTSPTAAFPDS